MRALLGVAQGSVKSPKVVIMEWKLKGSSKPNILIGKGVTFDTGGISLKPSRGMEEMIMDMGGSAVVVGCMMNAALSKSKKPLVGIIGLVENINYNKQAQLESGERPDFTFYLPKSKKINMDIKFPLDHYENYIDSDDDLVKNKERKCFLLDVKNHIKSITNRTYINLEDGTLDYVLMFIPNESIYAFINKEDQKIIDYALSNKVLLCSPLTLYAILSLLHQATINL